MRHGVAEEAHAPKHHEDADGTGTERQRDRADERAAHEVEFCERRDDNVVESVKHQAALRTHSCACSSKTSLMRRAAVRFDGVSTSSVRPQATASRASRSVCGNTLRTTCKSCSAASTVRDSPCQCLTTSSKSAAVLSST